MAPVKGEDRPRFAMLEALLEGLPIGIAVRGGPGPQELVAKGYVRMTYAVGQRPVFGPAQEPWLNVIGFLVFWHARPPELIRFQDRTTRTIPMGETLPWSIRTLGQRPSPKEEP